MIKSESKIQQEIIVWFRNNYSLKHLPKRECIFHVANEGQHRLINLGVLSGVSDLIFTWEGKTYYCEVKDAKGKQGPKQIEFEELITETGHKYFLVRTLEEFQTIIKSL